MVNVDDWAVEVELAGRRARFTTAELPITLGAGADADVRLDGVTGSLQIGVLDAVFFLQAGRGTRNLRVDGEPVVGSRKLADGETVAFDRARLVCRITGGRLALGVSYVETALDTAPPDFEGLARASAAAPEHVAITPISFKPNRGAQLPAERKLSRAGVATIVGFAVLGAFAWFAFTARSVEVRFDPPAAAVAVPGTLLKLRIGDRYLLRPGRHTVTAQLPGYYPFNQEVRIGPEQGQSLAFEFTKLPGLVTLTTSPAAGAEVLLDNEPLGRTPLIDVEITPGTHRLEFAAERYLTEVRELTVEGGGVEQALDVALTPNWAPVAIATEPAGAEVLVDGVAAGVTPATFEITAGEREVEVRLPGYNAWRNKVVVNANQPLELPLVTLTQADGRIELVSTPGEASVAVDGQFLGRTPLTLTLRPGRAHRVTLSKPGFEQASRELSVAADSGRRVAVELVQQFGEVAIASEPAGAEIRVDGQSAGTTPATLTLPAVAHEIEVRLAGYAPVQVDVTPRPGFAQELPLMTLVALDQTSGSGFAQTITTGLGQQLALVPAGQFLMGSSRREVERRSNETLRPVKISRAFYLGAREVTNAEFREFAPDHDSGEFGGLSLNDDDQPAVRVTWEQAARFMNWLSIRDGLQPVYEDRQGELVPVRPLRNGYRLPTEAEWEWAARAAKVDTPLRFPWGGELPIPDRSGNYADVAANDILPLVLVTYSDGFPVAAPVGRFVANAVGVYDLGGNVAEWVQDYYAIEAPGADSDALVEDPLGPETGRFHVVRGASWRSATERDLRLAARAYSGDSLEYLGFRIARNLE